MTVIKRYIVQMTNKAEIRPEEQSEKAESSRENLWNEIQLKGPLRQTVSFYMPRDNKVSCSVLFCIVLYKSKYSEIG